MAENAVKGHFELADCTNFILGEIADKAMKQRDISLTYALCLQSSEDKDWGAINKAIIERWSMSGLERIKAKAWKIVQPESKRAVLAAGERRP